MRCWNPAELLELLSLSLPSMQLEEGGEASQSRVGQREVRGKTDQSKKGGDREGSERTPKHLSSENPGKSIFYIKTSFLFPNINHHFEQHNLKGFKPPCVAVLQQIFVERLPSWNKKRGGGERGNQMKLTLDPSAAASRCFQGRCTSLKCTQSSLGMWLSGNPGYFIAPCQHFPRQPAPWRPLKILPQ